MSVFRELQKLLLILALLGQAPTAWAQESDSARAEAQGHNRRAHELYRQGNHEAALAEFLRAYEIAPRFEVLFNIGQISLILRRFPATVRAFEQYLADGGDWVPLERRTRLERLLADLWSRVGELRVEVTRPEAASVYVDGTEVGRTPLTEPLLVEAGLHIVEVRAEGFLPHSQEMVVAGGATVEVRVSLLLAEPPGVILVTVNVPGATVSLDGEALGTTPLAEAVTAPAGQHLVRVSRPGYEPAETEVSVTSGVLALVELTLHPSTDLPPYLVGELQVEASEEEAEFLLDGAPFAPGPAPLGPHRLDVRLEGFEPWNDEVEVTAGETARVEVTLRPTSEYRLRYETRARRMRLAAWMTATASLVVLGTTLGLFLWTIQRNSEWQDEQVFQDEQWDNPYTTFSEDELTPRLDANIELGHELQTWGYLETALLGLGIAAAGVAVWLFLAGPRPNRYTGLSLAPQRGGVVLGLSWEVP